jgi:hypothetical protein
VARRRTRRRRLRHEACNGKAELSPSGAASTRRYHDPGPRRRKLLGPFGHDPPGCAAIKVSGLVSLSLCLGENADGFSPRIDPDGRQGSLGIIARRAQRHVRCFGAPMPLSGTCSRGGIASNLASFVDCICMGDCAGYGTPANPRRQHLPTVWRNMR